MVFEVKVDRYHSNSDISDAAREKLKGYARAANIWLHLLLGGRHGRLNAERLRGRPSVAGRERLVRWPEEL